GVKGHFADGNAHAAGALIAKTENAFAVADHNALDAVIARVAEDLFDAIFVRIAEEYPARLSPDFAEALAALADRRRVHQGQHMFDVANDEGVEERFVVVLQVAEKGIFVEGGGLVV